MFLGNSYYTSCASLFVILPRRSAAGPGGADDFCRDEESQVDFSLRFAPFRMTETCASPYYIRWVFFIISLTLFIQPVDVAGSYLPAKGYTLYAYAGATSPADASTYYFGPFIGGNAITTAAGKMNIPIPITGIIKAAYIDVFVAGTLGTTETSTLSIGVNNTSFTAISSAVTHDATFKNFSNTSLSISVNQGDYIEIRWATPTWVTNPTTIRTNVLIYIEDH